MGTGNGLQAIWLLELQQELLHKFLSTRLTMPELILKTMQKQSNYGGGERNFHGLIDVYHITLQSNNNSLDNFAASFVLGWVITSGASVVLYPMDTVRWRMMMIFREVAKYKSSMDAFSQILKKEGAKSLFKGTGVVSSVPLPILVCSPVLINYRSSSLESNMDMVVLNGDENTVFS